jgi:DNA-binding IclR family transcriptional regulator
VAKDTVQAAILEAVKTLGGCATTAEIAEHLGKAKQNVNREILDLVDKGRLTAGRKDGKIQPYHLPAGVL